MKLWYYPALAAIVRGIWIWLGDIPGYIAGGILFAGIAAYWIRRLYLKHQERKHMEDANAILH